MSKDISSVGVDFDCGSGLCSSWFCLVANPQVAGRYTRTVDSIIESRMHVFVTRCHTSRAPLADALAADRKLLEDACGIFINLRDKMGPVSHAKLKQHDASWVPTAFVAEPNFDLNNIQSMPPQAPPPGYTSPPDFAGGPGFHGPPLPKQPPTGSPPRPPNYGVPLFPSVAPRDRGPHHLNLCCHSLQHLR